MHVILANNFDRTDWLTIFFQLLNDEEKPAGTEEELKIVEHNKASSAKSKVSNVRAIFFPRIPFHFI